MTKQKTGLIIFLIGAVSMIVMGWLDSWLITVNRQRKWATSRTKDNGHLGIASAPEARILVTLT